MMKLSSRTMALLLAVTAVVPDTAYAYGTTRGAISEIRMDPSTNRLFLKLANAIGGAPPACATGTTYTAALSLTSNNAQIIMELLISARRDGALVFVRGGDVCTVVSDVEDVSYVAVLQD